MLKNQKLSSQEAEDLDRYCREGGLRQMASPDVHYHEPSCPHPGCQQRMDFQLELFGDVERVYKPLVRSWWEGNRLCGSLSELRRLGAFHDVTDGGPCGRPGRAIPETARQLARGGSIRVNRRSLFSLASLGRRLYH